MFAAVDLTAFRFDECSGACSKTNRTARSRTLGEYVGESCMTPVLPGIGASGNPRPIRVDVEIAPGVIATQVLRVIRGARYASIRCNGHSADGVPIGQAVTQSMPAGGGVYVSASRSFRARVLSWVRQIRPTDALFAVLITWGTWAAIEVVRVEIARRSPRAASVAAKLSNWKQFADRGYATGPANAAVTLVVFSDFQCPYCQAFAAVVDSVRARLPNVRVVERNYPLRSLHPQAYSAALFAECAKPVGKYASVRSALFENEVLLSRGDWGEIAREAGISDTAGILRCLNTKRSAADVEMDVRAGNLAGVEGTPTILVNDSLFGPPPGLDELLRKLASRQGTR